MFKCEKCGNDSQPGERPTRVVVARRKREYPAFQRVNGTHDRGGIGFEIVREVVAHDGCATQLQAELLAAAPPTPTFTDAVVYADAEPHETSFNGVQVA
jgi:hypothetical protein